MTHYDMNQDELREKILEVLVNFYGWATEDVANRILALLEKEGKK